jgi:putative endonuclease
VSLVTVWVYIMANQSRTTYIGITRDIERRVWEHKTHHLEGFTSRYNITKLVHVEEYSRFDDAIAREKSLKGKSRAKKLALIAEHNPRWNDLAWNWFDEAALAQDRARHEKERTKARFGGASHGDSSLRSE